MKRDNIILTISGQLNSLKEDIVKLDDMLFLYSKRKCEEVVVFEKIMLLNEKYPSNSLVISRLLEFLQLTSDDELLHFFTLEDIGRIYKQLSDVFPDDVDINIEYYYYKSNVLDNTVAARQAIGKFGRGINEKLSKAINDTEAK